MADLEYLEYSNSIANSIIGKPLEEARRIVEEEAGLVFSFELSQCSYKANRIQCKVENDVITEAFVG